MSDKTVKVFAVVEFNQYINNKKAVELVPISWLSKDNSACSWPPKDQETNVQEWIKTEVEPGNNWDEFLVIIIAKANDYEQGIRRLERSFKKREVDESSGSESQSTTGNHLPTMSSARVALELAHSRPLSSQKSSFSAIDESLELTELGMEGELLRDRENLSRMNQDKNDTHDNEKIQESTTQQKKLTETLTSYNDVALYLESIIKKEMERTRRSINYAITERFKEILKTVQYSKDNPGNDLQAWKTIGEGLPFSELDEFLKFEDSLKTSEEKQKALLEIFKMVTAGSTIIDDDVTAIMGKMIKKDVQLLYSGCGKIIKGVGKKSFKATETFKVMEEFLLAKHVNTKEKISTVTLVSRFLSGAKDREGGRAHRDTK